MNYSKQSLYSSMREGKRIWKLVDEMLQTDYCLSEFPDPCLLSIYSTAE